MDTFTINIDLVSDEN